MSIPPRFLDEIRNRLTLSDIIGRRITVTRAGREFKACCPFHHEKSPSFTINDDKQFYHCFGCGVHGDVIGFVMQHDNLAFPDAVEMLATEAGLQMPKPDPQAAKKAERQKDLYDLMDAATKLMQAELLKPENKDIQDYLDGRGLGGETQQNFRIGYAPADGQALRKALSLQGYKDEMMLEAGILKKSTKGGEPYVFFRDRVMFPVADRRGRVVAFGGRILPDHVRPQTNKDFTPPKYINSSDTPLFDKGRMLYGESHARQAAREGHTIIVTEGYMDVIACHQAGFKGAVAPMGTAMTEEQIASLWSMMVTDEKSPVLCFDGDNAGRKAASRACERILPLLKPNQSARFAFMPEGEDPDSLIRNGGPKALRAVLVAAMPLFDFLWASHTAGRSFETPEQRAGLEKIIADDIVKIKDPDIQRYYKGLLRTKISETFFPKRQNYGQNSNTPQKVKGALSALKIPKPRAANDLRDRILLAAMINHPDIYPSVEEAFGDFHPVNSRLNDLRQCIIMACEDEEGLDYQALRHHLENQGFTQEIDDILNESVYVHAAFCRPVNQDKSVKRDIAQDWLSLWQSIRGQGIDKEIRDGWKQAYESANEDDEEKLRNLIRAKSTES